MFPKSPPKRFKHKINTAKTVRNCVCKHTAENKIKWLVENDGIGSWRDYSKQRYKELLKQRIKKVRPHVLGDFSKGWNHFYACYDKHTPCCDRCFVLIDKARKRKHVKGMYKSISGMNVETAIYFNADIETIKGTKVETPNDYY